MAAALAQIETKKSKMAEKPYDDRYITYRWVIYVLNLSFNPIWKRVVILCISYNFLVQTYVLTFHTSFRGYFLSRVIMDCVYIIEIILSVFYKFLFKRFFGNEHPRSAAMIVLDVITLLSFDYVIDFGPESRKNSFFVVMNVLLMLRIHRIVIYLIDQSSEVGNKSLSYLLLRITCATYMTLHVLACIWVLACGLESAPWTRGMTKKSMTIKSGFDKYITALYYTATVMCSVGFGDVYPITRTEYILTIVWEFTGIIWISITIALLLSHYDDKLGYKFQFSHRFNLIRGNLAENPNIPPHIVDQTLDFYKCLWLYKQGTLESSLFEILPLNIRITVFVDQYWEALEKAALLTHLDMPSKRALASRMRTQMHVKGDTIIKQGELRTFMMYVIRGYILVLSSEDTESPIIKLTEGTLLCEASLVLPTPSPVKVVAGDLCELQILDRTHVYVLANTYQCLSGVIHTTFFKIWDKAISLKFKRVHEESLSKALGIPAKEVEDIIQEESKNAPIPYTWLHEDEMIHFSYYPRKIKKTTGIYIKLKKRLQYADEILAFGRFPFIFQTESSFLLLWDFIVFITAICFAFIYPYRAALNVNSEFQIGIFISKLIYFTDLLISTMTAIEDEGRYMTTYSDVLWYRFAHVNAFCLLALDILSVFPFSFFYAGHSTAIINTLDLNHLLKTWKLARFFRTLERRFLIHIAVVRITECLLYVVIIAFWMGCAYYIQACFDGVCREASFYSKIMDEDMSPGGTGERFDNKVELLMLIGVGLISNSGYLDYIPINRVEIMIIIVVSVIAVFLFGYLVGTYTASLIVSNAPEVAFTELVGITKLFMEKNEVHESIQERVLQYLKLQWEYNDGYVILNNRSLYYDTPTHLYEEVLAAARHKVIVSVPLLEETELSLLNYIANHSDHYMLPPQETVVYSGTPCTAFYIIKEGFCQKYSGITGKEECTMGPQESFCVMEMLFGIPATSEIRTVTHVQLLRVTDRLLHQALSHFPITKNEIEGLVKDFKDNNALKKVLKREVSEIEGNFEKREHRSYIVFSKESDHYLQPFDEDWKSFLKYFLMRFTIVPNARFIKIYEAIRIAGILASCVFFPPYSYLWLCWKHLSILRYFFDIWTLLDMYILSHVCYYSKESVLVTHPKATFLNYFRHNFIIDLIAVIPFDLLSPIVMDSEEEEYYWSNNLAYFAYFPKVLLMYRCHSMKEYKEIGRHQRNYEIVLEDMLFIICSFIILNITATILVIITTTILFTEDGSHYKLKYSPNTWVFTKKFDVNNIFTCHVVAVYWTACLDFNVTHGDVFPLSSKEMVYVITTFLVGYAIVTYMMVRSGSTMAGLGIYYTIYNQNLKQLVEFLRKKSVSHTLRNSIQRHFVYYWEVTRSLDTQLIFSKFHEALQEDACTFLYESTFKECKIFNDMDFSFFRSLSMIVREVYYKSDSIISEFNDVLRDIFIIHEGEVTLSAAGDSLPIQLSRGSAFGNTADSAGVRISYSVKAASSVVLLKFDNRKFYELLEGHTHVKEFLKSMTADNKIYIVGRSEWVRGSDITLHRSPESHSMKMKIFRYGAVHRLTRQYSKYISFSFRMFLVICAAISFIVISYHAAFQKHSPSVFAIEIAMTVIFFGKLLWSLYMPHEPRRKCITYEDEQEVRRRYMLKWDGFWLDLLCFLPINLMCVFAPHGSRSEVWSYLNFFNFPRVYYLIQFYYLEFMELHVHAMFVDLAKIIFVMMFSLHISSCLIYIVACFKNSCEEDSWAYQCEYEDLRNTEYPADVYLSSFYVAANIYSSCAIGNITPITRNEIMLWTILIIIGLFHVSVLSGQISAVVVTFCFSLSNYDHEIMILQKYLKSCNVSKVLKQQVEAYAINLWYAQYGHQAPTMIDNMSPHLTSCLKKEIYGHHFENNPIFAHCHPDFLRQLFIHLKPMKYFIGNMVVRYGICNGIMYIIDEGEVAVLNSDAEKVDHLSAGDMFGVIQSFYRMTPHSYTYRAITDAVIITLNYKDWNHLLPFFPETYRELYERVHYFYIDRKTH